MDPDARPAAPESGGDFASLDVAASKWMKMISSTFLGEGAGGLFSRRPQAIAGDPEASARAAARKRGPYDVDDTPELKIALVGGPGVGKTSITRRWLQRSYPSTYSPTIGVDVSALPYVHKGESLLLHIWDVSSFEVDAGAASLHSLLCEGLDGIFFVFNVHRVSSIAAVDKWRHIIGKYVSAKEIPFFLLSHKADLLQKRVMISDDIAAYAQAAGYKGWMWTVGKSNFGENEKHPAVMEALDRMVEFILKNQRSPEHLRQVRLLQQTGILEVNGGADPLETIQMDDALHELSTSLLRIPTRAVTTLPRDENMQPINEEFDPGAVEFTTSELDPNENEPASQHSESDQPTDFGGNWIMGNEKGVYLRVTNRSIVANDETDEESDALEEFQFPFSRSRHFIASEDEGERNEEDEEERKREEEEEVLEQRREQEKREQDLRNDQLAWTFFAGSISRARAEAILENREEGTFLLRRKDSQTLILSYVGLDHVHHVLIEYANQMYHVGTSKSSNSTAFTSLWKCLRSVRRYAYCGLVFSRNRDFNVVNKEELSLESDETGMNPTTYPMTPSVWRARTRSGSSSSQGDRSANSSRQASPVTGASRKQSRRLPGLQASQENVVIPPQNQVEELRKSFYAQLTQRLQTVSAQLQGPTTAAGGASEASAAEEATSLLEMAEKESAALELSRSNDAETQWRHFVQSMEAWNRIVMNLELTALKVA